MSQQTPFQNLRSTIVIVAAVIAVVMIAALFLIPPGNQVAQPVRQTPPPVAQTGSSAGTNCQEFDAASAEVITTASGLQYQVLRQCDGARPSATSQVTVHYRGTLTDGTEFDSSYARGEPATFPLNGVIAGWTEGVQLMPVGSRYRFTIPSQLGYGERGAPPSIPPNATLIFDIELLSINS